MEEGCSATTNPTTHRSHLHTFIDDYVPRNWNDFGGGVLWVWIIGIIIIISAIIIGIIYGGIIIAEIVIKLINLGEAGAKQQENERWAK